MPLGTGATNPGVSAPKLPSLAWGGRGIGNVDAAKPPTRNSILGGLNATPIAQFKMGGAMGGVTNGPTSVANGPNAMMTHNLPPNLHGMVARIQSLSPAARVALFRAFGNGNGGVL